MSKMIKIFHDCTKKEETKPFICEKRSKQDQEKEFDEKDNKIIPYFSPSPTIFPNNNFLNKKNKLKPRLYMGNEMIFNSLLNNSLLFERVKKHFDPEYLEKYRKSYTFIPSPPRSEVNVNTHTNSLKMEITISQSKTKSSKNSAKKQSTKTSNQIKPVKNENKKIKAADNTQSYDHKKPLDDTNENLPIALRRTKRPTTRALRYWLGEKIVYKIDEETGCYTKDFEVKVNENEENKERQELIVEKHSQKTIFAKEKGKKIKIKNGELLTVINDNKYNVSSGGSIYLSKGQKVTFDNQSSNDVNIIIL